jgi:outer membrane lipoprotein SlyB
LAAGAVQNGAYAVGSSSSSTVARVATSAAAGAAGAAASAYTYASIVKTRDELALVSRLESGDGKVLLQRTDKRKASSDGEDLVTPVVQHAAEAIADVVTRTTR